MAPVTASNSLSTAFSTSLSWPSASSSSPVSFFIPLDGDDLIERLFNFFLQTKGFLEFYLF